MKKYLLMALAAFTLITVTQSCKKKVTDADLTTNVTKALTDKGMTTTTVAVTEGVVTLGGMCKDEQCKKDCETIAKDVKGVKSVVNGCMVTPPPASVTATLDAATMQKVKDGLKDVKGVTPTFEGDKVVLTGTITAANRIKVMQMLTAAKVKSDVSKLVTSK